MLTGMCAEIHVEGFAKCTHEQPEVAGKQVANVGQHELSFSEGGETIDKGAARGELPALQSQTKW